MTEEMLEVLRLFDVTTIPSRRIADASLALLGERWCPGSGVPGDNCEFGHPVDAVWADVAWREAKDVRRDTSRRETRAMCSRCEQTRRNYLDAAEDGDVAKARAWLSTEARKYAKPWGCTSAEARFRFEVNGVTLEFMTKLFKDAKARGTCPDWRHGGCGILFAPGPHDVTGDVKDPIAVEERGYLLADDIHAQCFTCNRKKNRKRWNEWLRVCAFFEYCKQYQPPGWQEHVA
jgi:hypothetical protein